MRRMSATARAAASVALGIRLFELKDSTSTRGNSSPFPDLSLTQVRRSFSSHVAGPVVPKQKEEELRQRLSALAPNPNELEHILLPLAEGGHPEGTGFETVVEVVEELALLH